MSPRRRAHGAKPQMSAALRHAFDELRGPEVAVGNRLVSVGIEPRDAEVAIAELELHYHEHLDLQRLIWGAVDASGDAGRDPDAHGLLDALAALPDGQKATLTGALASMIALGAAEGMAVGALYVAHEIHGRAERSRGRPRR